MTEPVFAADPTRLLLILCDSPSGGTGGRLCLYSAVCGFCACCQYAERCFGRYDRGGRTGGDIVLTLCRNFVVKIYRRQNQHRTSLQYSGSAGKRGKESARVYHGAVHYLCSPGSHLIRTGPAMRSGADSYIKSVPQKNSWKN